MWVFTLEWQLNSHCCIELHLLWKDGREKVGIPAVVSEYKSGMGSVNLLGRLCGSYRPSIYSKQWWWLLFIHASQCVCDGCVETALHQTLNPKNNTSHLYFLREITLSSDWWSSDGHPKSSANRSGGHHICWSDIVSLDHEHEKMNCNQGRCVVKHSHKECHLIWTILSVK